MSCLLGIETSYLQWTLDRCGYHARWRSNASDWAAASPTSPLEHDTYDLALYRLAVRDVAKYSVPVFEKEAGAQHDWEILATLSAYMLGFGRLPAGAVDDFVLRQLVDKAIPEDGSRSNGHSRADVMAALGKKPGPHRALDLMLRTGPYGDGFGRRPDGLTLDKLRANPHGIDLGALKPQLPGILETPSGKIDVAPKLILDDLPRLRARLTEPAPPMVGQHVCTTFHLFKAFSPLLASSGWGRVITVSPATVSNPLPQRGPYTAAKAAQENFVLTLAAELKESNVTANIIQVKAIDVDASRKGTGTRPDEIVAAMLYLFSDEAGKITGASIPLY